MGNGIAVIKKAHWYLIHLIEINHQIKFLFYYPLNHKQKERFRVYDVTEKNVKKIEKRLIEMVQKIKQLNFVATPTTRECGYCDYRNICTEAM